MNKKETEVVLQRIENWYARLPDLIVFDKQNFHAEFGWSKDPTPFQDRMELKYKKIEEGESWGEKWESAWFHLTGEVPKNWSGKQVATDLDFSGEGLVFDSDGVAIQGITNGAIWDQNFARTRVPFIDECSGGEKIELWVEAAANSLFGVFTEPDPEEQSPKRYGWFDAKVEKMKFGIFDNDLWHLYLDARILLGLVKHLDKKSVRRIRIIKSLNQCINIFAENRSNAQASRDCLKVELEKCASASDLKVSAIGHAHIDTGWLWPVRETVRKTARTFATQLKIIEQYPQYIFGASQPQHYQFMKDSYPEIYERVKAAVKSGNWECQGGMWVEADCNLISGESMVRQLLHGKNFFKNEFDVDVDNLWLPDVFGYSAALPQILKKSGVNFFLTQKLSWSQFNEFPHQTFHWRGIDGTEILTHFPPENTYNSELDTQFLLPAQSGFKEKDKLDEFISLFGVGDGGGGPKPENIELGIRMKDLENSPRVRFDTAKNFFHRLEKEKDSLDTWVGELYLELHRGTLTTHGLVKKQNRKLEWKLRAVEMLWSCADLDKYPAKELDAMWKKLLINQFHDIIPGSSINMVYQTTHKEYEEIHKGCDDLIDQSANILFQEDRNAFVLMNSLSYKWEGMVTLPESLNGYELLNENGERVKVQKIGEKIEAFVSLNPLSFSTFRKGEKSNTEELTDNGLILENELIRYEDLPLGSSVIYVSHEWLGWVHPDPDGIQLSTLVEILKNLKSGNISRVDMNRFHSVIYNHTFSVKAKDWKDILENTYIWVDWMCMPQPSVEDPNDKRRYEDICMKGSRAIRSIPAYIEKSDFMLILCPEGEHVDRKERFDKSKRAASCFRTWRRRGWCVLEFFACYFSVRKSHPTLLVRSGSGTPEWISSLDCLKLAVGTSDFTCCQRNHIITTSTQKAIMKSLESKAEKERQEKLSSRLPDKGFVSVGCPGACTSLMIAMSFGNENIVNMLLDAGANPYERCAVGNDVLQCTAIMNRVELARFWIERFPDWDFDTANYIVGGKALLSCVFMGPDKGELTDLLMISGANPFCVTHHGSTLLVCASENEDTSLELLQSLCERFPELVNKQRRSQTWTFKTISTFCKFLKKCHLSSSPIVEMFSEEPGCVCLHFAVKRGDLRAVEILLNAGANPNIRNDMGQTPIDFCDTYGPYPKIKNKLMFISHKLTSN